MTTRARALGWALVAAAAVVASAGCARRDPAAPAVQQSARSTGAADSAGAAAAEGASRGGPVGVGAGAAPQAAQPPAAEMQQRAGSSNPLEDHRQQGAGVAECRVDADCVCGIDRATANCAVGPASRVDTDRQCPDFCHGIDGRTRIVCDQGRCAQVR